MSWYSKEHETPLDRMPVEGAFFLHGDAVAQRVKTLLPDTPYEWSEGMKAPMIAFPSGEVLPLEWDGEGNPLLHLFAGMELPLFSTFEQGVKRVQAQIEDGWFSVFALEDTELELWSHFTEEVFFVIYDREAGRIMDVMATAA